jgi:myo-inositol-1(or 4)-monophosphatase
MPGRRLDGTEALAALDFARQVVLSAAALIRGRRPASVTSKTNPADLVTDVDIDVECMIREAIATRYPGHAVEGEELARTGGQDAPTWYLDPVDGTTNYASGLPWCSVSLALADGQGPLAGVVADPWRDEIFSAARGHGAHLGTGTGTAYAQTGTVRCSAASTLAGSVVLTEWNGNRPWPGMSGVLADLTRQHATVRILGSSALSVASVAAGRAAAALIGAYQPVDDMAAVLIAREAGAVVAGRRGGEPDDSGLLVAAPGLATQLSATWRRGMT